MYIELKKTGKYHFYSPCCCHTCTIKNATQYIGHICKLFNILNRGSMPIYMPHKKSMLSKVICDEDLYVCPKLFCSSQFWVILLLCQKGERALT